HMPRPATSLFVCFSASAATDIHTLSLHDALPIYESARFDVERTGALADRPGRLVAVPLERVARDFRLTTDSWSTEDFAFTIYSPDRKSTRLNSSHVKISYAVFCLKKKKLSMIKTV